MNEPAWIEHDGSAVCPVPAGVDCEVDFGSATTRRSKVARHWNWLIVKRYRDWTAFEKEVSGRFQDLMNRQQPGFDKQQEAMGKDAPEWLPRLKDDTQALKYRVNNPFAWEAYSEEGSEQLRRAVRLLEEVIAAHEQPPVDPIDRLRDAIEALHGIHFDRDKMEQIVRRADIDSLAAAGEGE